MWHECFDLEGLCNDLAHLPAVFDQPCPLSLHHYIANGCSLDRSCHNWDSNGVGCELAHKIIGRASAYYVQFFNLEWCESLEHVQSFFVSIGKAMVDATYHLPICLRYPLS